VISTGANARYESLSLALRTGRLRTGWSSLGRSIHARDAAVFSLMAAASVRSIEKLGSRFAIKVGRQAITL
jgi:hypothetical protein